MKTKANNPFHIVPVSRVRLASILTPVALWLSLSDSALAQEVFSRVDVSGNPKQVTNSKGPVTVTDMFTVGTRTNTAAATSNLGSISLSSSQVHSDGTPSEVVRCKSLSQFHDDLKIVAGDLTGPGTLTVKISTSGNLDVQTDPANPSTNSDSQIRLAVTVVNGTGFHGSEFISITGHRFDNGFPFLNRDALVELPIFFGTEPNNRVIVTLDTDMIAGTVKSSTVAAAESFWGGIVSVKDSNGALIQNYTVTSASGTDYKTSLKPKQNLWSAGADLLANEKDDLAAEANGVNAKVPEWSYGFRQSAAGTAFTKFTAGQHQNDLGHPEIDGWAPGAWILVNTGSVPISLGGAPTSDPLQPGQMVMQPTATGFAVARWIAPEAGTYNIAARWVDVQKGGGNGGTAHVVVNGEEIFGGQTGGGTKGFIGAKWNDGGKVAMAPRSVRLEAGATVDFVVGSRGEASADLTAMNCVIRRAPFVTLTAGTLPCTFDAATQTSTCTATAGQNVMITAGSSDSLSAVSLYKDGAVEGTGTAAPFEFPLNGLTAGDYYLQAEAKGADGVVGASNAIVLKVNQSTVARARPSSKASSAAGTTYEAIGGIWSDPNTWKRTSDGAIGVGVPGPADIAHVPDAVQVVVTADTTVLKLFCVGLLRGENETAEKQMIVTGQVDISGSMKSLILRIPPGGELTAIKGTALLENVQLLSSGRIRLVRSVWGTGTNVDSTGTLILQAPPGSGGPTVLRGQQIQFQGLASAGPGTAMVAAGGLNLIGNDGGTLIGNDGSTLVGDNGSTLIGNDGSTLIGNDGSTLVGNDGGTLIGNDGSTLVGDNGASLVGDNGASLVGNDGASLGQINVAALIGNDGGTIALAGSTNPGLERRIAATMAGGTSLTHGGILTGRLNVIGSLVNDGGFVMPGSSAGRIFIAGDYTQTATGSLVLELGGTQPGQFDKMTVTGTANLGGNLIVKTINAYTPAQGDAVSPLIYTSHTGSFGQVSSNTQITFGANGAQVTVNGPNPPAPKALNIATRMKVETGDNVLIAGFIITGSQSKKVIIRGIGPSLPFAGVLADPTLNLDNGAISNDNWRSTQEQEIIATTIPPSNNLESAIVATLNPGAHTAILRGTGNATGIGLVEVYDLESGSPVQLANISSRGFVQAGDDVMIGGFIIGGTYPARVIVRAIGPSLPFAGVLADPTLELVDQNGGRINNDNWRSTQEADIIATTVPPNHDNEAAIVATLAPGNYTAIVRGVDDTTGIAVVEAYNLQ